MKKGPASAGPLHRRRSRPQLRSARARRRLVVVAVLLVPLELDMVLLSAGMVLLLVVLDDG